MTVFASQMGKILTDLQSEDKGVSENAANGLKMILATI
jgi:hypothetical protein